MCFGSAGENLRTWREPTHTQGQRANITHLSPSQDSNQGPFHCELYFLFVALRKCLHGYSDVLIYSDDPKRILWASLVILFVQQVSPCGITKPSSLTSGLKPKDKRAQKLTELQSIIFNSRMRPRFVIEVKIRPIVQEYNYFLLLSSFLICIEHG